MIASFFPSLSLLIYEKDCPLMNTLNNTLKRIFHIKRSSPLVQPLITLLYLDIFHALMISILLILVMVIDHELIVRTLILSVYILCPMAALDFMRHINMVTIERYHRVRLQDNENGKDFDDWTEDTTTDVGLLWILPPIFSSFFLAGSVVDFSLYINHEVENSEPPGLCTKGCAASIFGVMVTALLFISSVVYISMMIRIFRKLNPNV